MLIKINLKKEFFYLLFLIPICMLKFILEFYIQNSKFNYYSIIEPLSQTVMIFLYLYQKIESKLSSLNNKNLKINRLHYVYQNLKNVIFLLCSIIFFLIPIYLKKYDLKNIYSHTIIIFLVDLLFFQKEIYSHQILSIILNIISYIIIVITNPSLIFTLFYNFVFLILNNYCDSFSILLIKYINNIYFTSIYLLGFLIGLFSLLFQLILINFTLDEIKKAQYIVMSVYFINCVIFNIFYYYIMLKLDPIHSKICIQISYLFIRHIINEKNKQSVFELLKIISGLIYLEILEFNFWGLNKNLKKYITLRSENDTNLILTGEIQIYENEEDN